MRLRIAIGGKSHAAAKIDDFENDLRVFLMQANLRGGAAGMALNVGEALLDDAEEGEFDGLREAVEIGEDAKVSADAAALAEAVGVLLEGRDEAEVVEERWMEEIGKGANLTRHLLGKGTSAFEGMGSGVLFGGE